MENFTSKEEFLRPPFERIESMDLSAFSGDAKEFRFDSNSDIKSFFLPDDTNLDEIGIVCHDIIEEIRKRGWKTE